MIKFKAERYDNADLKWYTLPNVVYPLGLGGFLDERLDEAYLTFYDSTPHYESGTIFKITVNDGTSEQGTVFYFVLDSDASRDVNLSGRYNHTLHLIEPTKLTEGVLCQTLSFTNDLGSDATEALGYAIPTYTEDNTQPYLFSPTGEQAVYINSNLKDLLLRPIYATGTRLTLPTISQVTDAIVNALNIENPQQNETYKPLSVAWVYGSIVYTPRVTITQRSNGEEIITTIGQNYNATPPETLLESADELQLTYAINFERVGAREAKFASIITFTSRITETLYPTLPYTITSMTNRCLILAEPRFKAIDYTPRFKFDGCRYDIPGTITITPGSQADEYSKVFADEITLTGATLREQLKGIARLIHAEPRVYITEIPGAGSSSYLDFWVRYDKYGETASAIDQYHPYTYRALSQSINEYCTEIRTNAANLVNSLDYAVGVISDPLPAGNDRGVRSLRADSVGVRINSTTGIAESAEAIYKPTRVECGVMGGNYSYTVPLTDITAFVVERAAYDLLDPYEGEYPVAKSYALYYTQGQPNIGGLFFKATVPDTVIDTANNYYAIINILALATGQSRAAVSSIIAESGEANIVFRIEYIPMYSTTLSHSKQRWNGASTPFAQIYSQGENIIEARYFGENVKGTAAKLGNVAEERTYMLKRLSDIPRVGYMLDGFSVASCASELYPTFIKCTVGLSKDYNRINEYVGINSHKRIYEVSEREAYERNILIKENLVLSKEQLRSNNRILENPSLAFKFRGDLAGASIAQISSVMSEMKDFGGNSLSLVSLPVISSSFGNALIFTWKYADNYSAGQSAQKTNAAGVSGTWSVNVPYSDKYGRAERCSFGLFNKTIVTDGASTFPFDSPDIKEKPGIVNPAEALIRTQYDYIIKKDSRERINTFNYELEFRTTEDDLIIGSAIASANPLVCEGQLCHFYALTEPPNKFERTLDPDKLLKNADDDPLQISYDRPSIEDNSKLIFPTNDTGRSIYWVFATELRQVEKGPFVDIDGSTTTYTEWSGGELILACTAEIAPGEKLYDDLYLSIQF